MKTICEIIFFIIDMVFVIIISLLSIIMNFLIFVLFAWNKELLKKHNEMILIAFDKFESIFRKD